MADGQSGGGRSEAARARKAGKGRRLSGAAKHRPPAWQAIEREAVGGVRRARATLVVVEIEGKASLTLFTEE